MSCQVLVLGHLLGPETLAAIEAKYGPVKVYESFFQAPKMNQQLEVIDRCFRQFRQQGADMSGRTVTLIALPGLSVASTLAAAVWAGVSGSLPVVINLIKQTSADKCSVYYAPSPELPFIDLQSVRTNYGLKMRSGQFQPKPQAKVAA